MSQFEDEVAALPKEKMAHRYPSMVAWKNPVSQRKKKPGNPWKTLEAEKGGSLQVLGEGGGSVCLGTHVIEILHDVEGPEKYWGFFTPTPSATSKCIKMEVSERCHRHNKFELFWKSKLELKKTNNDHNDNTSKIKALINNLVFYYLKL